MGEGEPYRVSPATESRPGLLRGSLGHGLRRGSLLPLARRRRSRRGNQPA